MKTPFFYLTVKESRQLLPIIIMWSGVLLLATISQLATVRIDEQSFSKWCAEFCDPGLGGESMFFVVFMSIFCLVTAYSLFPREHDESTIDFLHALPISRASIFAAKCLAAWLAMSVITVLSYYLDFHILAFNSQSIDGKAYPGVMATQALRDVLFAYVVIAHGVFLSRFRMLGLVAYAVYLLGLVWWENSFGGAGAYNLLTFYTNEFEGERLILNWSTIVPQLIAATVIYWLAYRIWNRAGSYSTPRLTERRRFGWLGIVGSVLIFLLISGAMVNRFVTGSGSGDRDFAATEHYDFIFRPTSVDTVEALIKHADDDYQALMQLLRVDDEPSIVADLTANKGHVAGLAVWKKIQMDIGDVQDDVYYRRVLSHETTHVFQSVMSNRNLSQEANATNFFTEGMAQLTSFRVVPDESTRRKNWIVAALAWKRHKIRFRDLADFAAFQSRFDAELVYTLADTWVEALVQTCGDRILGDVLLSVGREDARRGLPGETYWRYILQHIDCELELVNVAWFALMEGSLTDDADRYPEFGAVSFLRDSTSSVTVAVELITSAEEVAADQVRAFAETLEFYLRLQPGDGLTRRDNPLFRGEVQREGARLQVVFNVPAANISADRIRYQVGFQPEPDARVFFERWQSTAVLAEP